MRGDQDNDLKACLSSVASLIDQANELAKRSVEAAGVGHPDSAGDIAIEVDLLLDEAAERLTIAVAINEQSHAALDGLEKYKDADEIRRDFLLNSPWRRERGRILPRA